MKSSMHLYYYNNFGKNLVLFVYCCGKIYIKV